MGRHEADAPDPDPDDDDYGDNDGDDAAATVADQKQQVRRTGSRTSIRPPDEVLGVCSDSVLHCVRHRKPPLPLYSHATPTTTMMGPGKVRSRRGTFSAPR